MTKLLFGIHCHQPVENFHYVVDEAIEKSYKPFLFMVKNYPNFKFSIHYSGWLLEYIQKNDPILFDIMQKMAKNGQIEFFTGGFYEPILASISSGDRVEQIKKLSKYIKKYFDQTPKGIWLTERVWDDSIIGDLATCGIEYAIVDDYHLKRAGIKDDSIGGIYVSDNGENKIALFGINQDLRYKIPFSKPQNAIEEIKKIKSANQASIIFDDGEKFGLWPNTYDWVYEKGWLEEFMELLGNDKDVECQTFEEFYKQNRILGKVYLPNVSYFEMSKWSLSPQNYESFLQGEKILEGSSSKIFYTGGTWKNFFIKYPQSGYLRNRVLELSRKKSQISTKDYDEAVFKSQANDVFWHGVFGGIYLPNLRDNAYSFIIEAENIAQNTLKEKKIEIINFIDSTSVIKFNNDQFIAIFDPSCGGQMRELSIRDKKFNYQNTLSRIYELYHIGLLDKKIDEDLGEKINGQEDKNSLEKEQENIQKEEKVIQVDSSPQEEISTIHHEGAYEGELRELHYDWFEKNSFVDHITNDDFCDEDFKNCTFREYGDFTNQPFEWEKEAKSVVLTRKGGIYDDGGKQDTILRKLFKPSKNKIDFEISIDSCSAKEYIYVLEFNFHFENYENIQIENNNDGSDNSENSNSANRVNKILLIKDNNLQKSIKIIINKDFKLFSFPLSTISKSEHGYDETLQCLSFGLAFKFVGKLEIIGGLEIL